MAYDKFYEARDILLDFIRREIVGPAQPDEVLDEPPLDVYACGILWPKKTSEDHEPPSSSIPLVEDSSTDIADLTVVEMDEGEGRDIVSLANEFRPSVMGLSFALPSGAETMNVRFTCARYELREATEEKGRISRSYVRIPLDTDRMKLRLPAKRGHLSLFGGIAILHLSLRRRGQDGVTLWTLSIENCQDATTSAPDQNAHALFQCELRSSGAAFQPVDQMKRAGHDLDRRIQNMLYRDTHQYAAGHGCSAQWEEKDGVVQEVRSSFLPLARVPQTLAATADGFRCFLMSAWTDSWRTEGLDELQDYIETYRAWIQVQAERARSLPDMHKRTAAHVLDGGKACIARMETGVQTLREDETAWRAFKFANEAMMRQSAKRRRIDESEVAWYPFQLCYLLMCIPDVVDEGSVWHDTVDLLWFSTGGGKTEAYLGVAAFTIFYRRLRHGDAGKGVTVLMRYTLRMLTAQQFERAAALICQCELIRRREGLGDEEISIGMWVGGGATPNHVTSPDPEDETAEVILERLRNGERDRIASTPVQLALCPHCGMELDVHQGYSIRDGEFRAHCPNGDCPFHADLPVVTVDDDIYKRRPTLLIGTIDKFARVTWEPRTGAIFAKDGLGMPPSLLIQDELHLISGPLGSISGLYENMIDALCETKDGARPKILASTATLSNAKGQIRALYRRDMFQFPPFGLDADDSFFARTARPDERPERLYVGSCETGGSLSDAVIRIFATLYFGLRYLEGLGRFDQETLDQFWTNIGYFNSLKDLGSVDTLILDRVQAYVESLRLHKFKKEAEEAKLQRASGSYEAGELTSRKSSYEIGRIRDDLDRRHYPDEGAYDYVLSSNMLSVGLDIGRLGVMTMYGQPRSTAEYIQATSRVGRSKPGLIIVLFHMLKARDKGHFEQFQSYHQTLDRMVEPTSATPYACRALEKALHAVFVALVRHKCPDLLDNAAAARFSGSRPDVLAIYEELLEDVRAASPESHSYAKDLLDSFIRLWEERSSFLVYDGKGDHDAKALLIPAERGTDLHFPPTMNSMREVDTQSGVYMVQGRTSVRRTSG